MRDRLGRAFRWLSPSPSVRRGAGRGLAAAVLFVAAVSAADLRLGFGVLDVPIGALVGIAIAALAGLGAALALRVLEGLRALLTAIGLAAVVALVVVLNLVGFPLSAALVWGLGLALIEVLLGGSLATLRRDGLRGRRTMSAVVAVVALAVGIAGNATLVWFLAIRGWSDHLVKAVPETARVEPLAAPDPSLPGAYRVRTLTYGSGDDRRRPEFGAGAALKTTPVDATPFVKGNEGFKMKARAWYWGFDVKHLPRNGRVWYPDGAGPFPLVLIVHGNHTMESFSDPGYAYLADHLASHGFIAVSVDENFFNGSWAGGLERENDGRAWLLLEHLELWRTWNGGAGNPFFGKVDMGAIGLVGHSRGGEAVALAGVFNRLRWFPDDATIALPSGFAIKAIVAIAPSDGQYSPSGKPNPLENVDYLVIQGGHDSDVSTFMGSRQYARVRFTDGRPWFKASVYAYRANHGQFNTVWGDTDLGWPERLLLNRRPLLTGDDQRRLAKVVIGSFLEAALKGNGAYRSAFRDLRRARPWLPDDIYVTRFADSTFRTVADFEEDIDVTTATLSGATIAGHGLAVWREQNMPIRKGESRQNGVVVLGWRRAAGTTAVPASYEITLPEGTAAALGMGARSSLAFGLAPSDETPPDADAGAAKTPADRPKEAEEGRAGRPAQEPLEISVELADAKGAAVRVPLSRFRAIPPALRSRFTKLPNDAGLYGKATEPVLQDFELPLAAFAGGAARFDPSKLRVIRFVFDRSPAGVVILDDISLVPGTN